MYTIPLSDGLFLHCALRACLPWRGVAMAMAWWWMDGRTMMVDVNEKATSASFTITAHAHAHAFLCLHAFLLRTRAHVFGSQYAGITYPTLAWHLVVHTHTRTHTHTPHLALRAAPRSSIQPKTGDLAHGLTSLKKNPKPPGGGGGREESLISSFFAFWEKRHLLLPTCLPSLFPNTPFYTHHTMVIGFGLPVAGGLYRHTSEKEFSEGCAATLH